MGFAGQFGTRCAKFRQEANAISWKFLSTRHLRLRARRGLAPALQRSRTPGEGGFMPSRNPNEGAKAVWTRRGVATLALAMLVGLPALGQQKPVDLASASIEDLMNVEVTSVSRREQKLSRTASAVFVIGADDIRQSGATNIPDLLRMAPGVQVAQIDSGAWAITIRGFNGQYSNDLLVLVDGRTVYSPIFAGVFWNTENVPLENIERIEVIRGPGATVWGANAVNGVINIITRNSSDTQGGLISAAGGTYDQGVGIVRYGGKMGAETTFRANVSGINLGHFPGLDGQNGRDAWHAFSAGFRIDSHPTTRDKLMFQGDVTRGSAGELVNAPVSIFPPQNAMLALRDRFSEWDVVSRWEHAFSPTSQTSLQVYFDRSNRGDSTYGFGLNTFDVDFQHHLSWGDRQEVVWGAGYRMISDTSVPGLRVSLNPAGQRLQLFSGFVQDEIAISPNRLYLTAGAKLEHNTYTGFGVQPSVRMDWLVNENSSAWAAVSRALRTPSRVNESIRLNYAALPGPTGVPLLVSLFGNPDYRNEELLAVETGYRRRVAPSLWIDAAAFFNQYDQMLTVEPLVPFLEFDPMPPHIVIPSHFENLLYGETHGVEAYAEWKPWSWWTLSPGYAYFTSHMHTRAGSLDAATARGTDGGSPNHGAQLRSSVKLPLGLDWNASAYFVGRLYAQQVPSYTRLDTNLVWQANERFSISLAGQNLLKDHHLEYNGPNSSLQSSQVKRSAYVKMTWQF